MIHINPFDVSIPIWCDWKLQTSLFPLLKSLVSIPIWCDWKKCTLPQYLHEILVSIPIWCDWKLFWLTGVFLFFLFQFLYGAIGRKPWKRRKYLLSRFNSYMVRLEVNSQYFISIFSCVSIPIWCDWK